MVVTCLPATAETGVTHERIGLPSRCTVQAPHSAMPQPNLVPVRPELVAQHPEQRRVGGGAEIDLLAVDEEFGHGGISEGWKGGLQLCALV